MKTLFSGYYRPSEQEFSRMWQEALFVFDANMLLNVYRYSSRTQQRFFEVLTKLKDRIWLPHQAALEYHRDRLDVISEQSKVYDDLVKLFNNTQHQLESQRHLFIDLDQILQLFKDAIEKSTALLEKSKSTAPDLVLSDQFLEKITELFDGRVGQPFSDEDLTKIHKEAEARIKQEIPPGYKDAHKEGLRRYGDVVLWFQILNQAQLTKQPVIFMTDDRKEDWWRQHHGKTIGPRPELIQEMYFKSGVSFYMYQTDQFLERAETFLSLSHQPEVIEEVKEVQERSRLQDYSTETNDILTIQNPLVSAPPQRNSQLGQLGLADLISKQNEAIAKALSAYPKFNISTVSGVSEASREIAARQNTTVAQALSALSSLNISTIGPTTEALQEFLAKHNAAVAQASLVLNQIISQTKTLPRLDLSNFVPNESTRKLANPSPQPEEQNQSISSDEASQQVVNDEGKDP